MRTCIVILLLLAAALWRLEPPQREIVAMARPPAIIIPAAAPQPYNDLPHPSPVGLGGVTIYGATSGTTTLRWGTR